MSQSNGRGVGRNVKAVSGKEGMATRIPLPRPPCGAGFAFSAPPSALLVPAAPLDSPAASPAGEARELLDISSEVGSEASPGAGAPGLTPVSPTYSARSHQPNVATHSVRTTAGGSPPAPHSPQPACRIKTRGSMGMPVVAVEMAVSPTGTRAAEKGIVGDRRASTRASTTAPPLAAPGKRIAKPATLAGSAKHSALGCGKADVTKAMSHRLCPPRPALPSSLSAAARLHASKPFHPSASAFSLPRPRLLLFLSARSVAGCAHSPSPSPAAEPPFPSSLLLLYADRIAPCQTQHQSWGIPIVNCE